MLSRVTIFDYGVEHNNKNSKFKVGDHVRISKYKNDFAKGYTPNWSEEVFVISKTDVPWIYSVNNFNEEEIIEIFYEKEFVKIRRKEFRIEKLIKTEEKVIDCMSSRKTMITHSTA